MRNYILVGVGSAIIGGIVGALIASKITKDKLEAIHEEEIQQVKDYYGKIRKVGPYANLDDLARKYREEVAEQESVSEAYKEGLRNLGYVEPEDDDSEEEVGEPDDEFFADNDSTEETEVVFRDSSGKDHDLKKPYVISFEEFHDECLHHEKTTLYYYDGDDVLSDDRDKTIDNIGYVVGDDFLTQFGNGSKDDNIVYVRNHKISMDFEVVRREGKYSVEVLGFDEPKPPKIRKMKKEE